MQIGILEGDRFSEKAIQLLRSLGNVRVLASEPLEQFLADKDVLFVRLGRHIDEALLALAPRLRIICSPTTGHTHFDEKALARRGVLLLSLRGERDFLQRIHATPEHTLGLVFSLLRNYRFAFLNMQNRGWDRDRYRGEGLSGKVAGIIGMGRVGKRIAQYLTAFEVPILFYDPDHNANYPGAQRLDTIDDVLEGSDIVVMCAAFVLGSDPIIDRKRVGLLKGKYWVNTARGELVDEQALLEGIRQNWFKGVATDVIADETGAHRLDDWLQAAEGRNVIITPHIAGATVDAMHTTEEFMVEKLVRALQQQESAR